jgi:hypothetical protein
MLSVTELPVLIICNVHYFITTDSSAATTNLLDKKKLVLSGDLESDNFGKFQNVINYWEEHFFQVSTQNQMSNHF